MKGQSRLRFKTSELQALDAGGVALQVLGRLVEDPERLGRFLAMSGLDPSSIRTAAADPGFLPAVLDHVLADERLLVAIAAEAGLRPETIAEAQRRLSPVAEWSP